MENTFEQAMSYINKLDTIDTNWNKDKKIIASAMVSYTSKIMKEKIRIAIVGNCSSLSPEMIKQLQLLKK